MAENKKSFVLYADLIHTIEQMPKEKAGDLFLHILKYVNDLNPVSEDLIINLTFEPIKRQMKRDLVKWEETLEQKRIAGIKGNLKRWHKDLFEKVEKGEFSPDEANEIAHNRTRIHPTTGATPPDTGAIPADDILSHPVANIADTVNDNVTVNVNVTLKDSPETSSGLPVSDNFELEEKTASTEIVNAKPKKEKAPIPENVRLLRADIRNFFLTYYQEKINMAYYWTPKDAVALIEVVKKIEFQLVSKNVEVTDQEILNTFQRCVTAITDKWLIGNMSMPILSSKSNEIFNQIKNPNHGKLDHKQRAELAFRELKAKGLY